jgi:hypothetical protein
MPDPVIPNPVVGRASSAKPSLAELLATMPNVGRDSDFARVDEETDAPAIFE